MSCLQGRILAVVREAQDLLGFFLQVRPHQMRRAERTKNVVAELRPSVESPKAWTSRFGCFRVIDVALEDRNEGSWNEPEGTSLPPPPLSA
jgi:hypothetical protein